VNGPWLAGYGKRESDIPDGHAVGVLEFIIFKIYDIDA
jgi:hypothetical protein